MKAELKLAALLLAVGLALVMFAPPIPWGLIGKFIMLVAMINMIGAIIGRFANRRRGLRNSDYKMNAWEKRRARRDFRKRNRKAIREWEDLKPSPPKPSLLRRVGSLFMRIVEFLFVRYDDGPPQK